MRARAAAWLWHCVRREQRVSPDLPSPTCLVHPPANSLSSLLFRSAVSLFGVYLLLKYLPDFNIQSFLNAYFWLLGSIAMVGAFGPTLRTLVSRA